MNLLNKKLLQQKIATYEFPNGEQLEKIKKLIEGWQKAIKNSNLDKTSEISIQGDFLTTFFQGILGYTSVVRGDDEWSINQHTKNDVDATKPDGTLGWFNKEKKETLAVIELKDAKTPLDMKQMSRAEKYTPIEQAYLYSTKYSDCKWVIVSNFREIRLYSKSKNQENYEKFNVLDLSSDIEFKRFYFTLCRDNLITKGVESPIEAMAKETNEVEKDITKQFYQHYREARLYLLNHLIENNLSVDKELLLEKTQKFLDRFVFTLFCEDTSSLLPLNLIKNTYERAINSLSPSDERVWSEFRGLFLAIDKGNTRVQPPINAYNGGLFAKDEVLDSLVIKDVFWEHIMGLTKYDFETDLNVNILGHIFEQSISDLESLKSELLGEEQDKKKSKRKKDGIFYTPEYITKYIVENTIGKYLEENPDRLETIKILDPACGSGAFLNQAHSYLINEYKTRFESLLAEKQAKGEAQTLFDYNPADNDRSILLNNLYGVDLNQESVEITKLALWLKTARRTEPLQNLDKNIKCGNSLISDSVLAGKKSFNWEIEYKDILTSGGFDIVIGNPPYISSIELSKTVGNDVKSYWVDKYQSARGTYDIYVLFFEQGMRLLNENGILAFITPNKFLSSPYGLALRELILKEYCIEEIFDLSKIKVFDDPSVYPVITIIRKVKSKSGHKIRVKDSLIDGLLPEEGNLMSADILTILPDNLFSLLLSDNPKIIEKINKQSQRLDTIAKVNATSTASEADIFSKFVNENETGVKLVNTGTIDSYASLWGIKDLTNKGGKFTKPILDIEKIPTISEHRSIIYKSPKIIFAKVAKQIEAFLDKAGEYASINTNCVYDSKEVNLPTLLALFNSKLMNYYYKQCFGALSMSGGYLQFQAPQIRTLPVPLQLIKNNKEHKLAELAINQQSKTKEYLEKSKSVLDLLKSEYQKVENWKVSLEDVVSLGFNELISIIDDSGIQIELSKKEELQSWLKLKQSELDKIRVELRNNQRKIDNEVYTIYDLTSEEIAIIEK